MDYTHLLKLPISKMKVNDIAAQLISKPQDFDRFFQLIFSTDSQIAWRAAWALQKLSEKRADLFTASHIQKLIDVAIITTHGGFLRGCLSIINNKNILLPISVPFINACFDWMTSPRYPAAVHSLAMKLLYRICQLEPDFKSEFKASLENVFDENYTTSFISCRKNILKLLNNI